MAKVVTHYLSNLLEPWAPIEVKRMFGGLGIWREGTFFALIDDDNLYFKVNATSRPEYARLNSAPFSYQIVRQGVPNLKIIDSLWRVPDVVLDEPDILFAWAQQAYEAASTGLKSRPDDLKQMTILPMNSKVWVESLYLCLGKSA